MTSHLFRFARIVALGSPLLAAAQPATLPSTPAAAPAYRSAFADYAPYTPVPRADWRAVNDAVARAAAGGPSGHAGHTTGDSRTAPAQAPAHSMHGGPAMPNMPAHPPQHGGSQ